MSPIIVEQLDPQPFRDWVDERLGADPDDAAVAQLVFDLGLTDRRLHRWRYENKSLERIAIEDALHHADVGIWEVYPRLADEPVDGTGLGRGNLAGEQSKLSDEQLLVLYAIHVERGVTIKRLGEELWQSLGYASSDSARLGIGRGFRRLGLKARYRNRETFGLKRCGGVNRQGERCGQPPMTGEAYCFAHHPDTRERLRVHALSISPFVKQPA